MEKIIPAGEGPSALIAGLIIILALHLIMKVAEFVFDILKKKNELTEKNISNLISALSMNTEAIHRLEERMRAAETALGETSKQKVDIRKLFFAVKRLAGDSWADLRKSINEEDLTT